MSLDLSNIYYYDSNITGTIRKYDGGLLKSEIVNGSEFASDGNSSCMIKDAIETGCTRNGKFKKTILHVVIYFPLVLYIFTLWVILSV